MKTDYAYCAGLFDGEGCIQIEKMNKNFTHRQSPQYQLKLNVNMTSIECIKKIQGIFGGKIYSRKREGTNWICHAWYLFSNNAMNALKKMLPYLKEKKEQAISAIQFQQMLNIRKKQQLHLGQNRTPLSQQEILMRDKYYNRLKELKTEKLIPIASKGLS